MALLPKIDSFISVGRLKILKSLKRFVMRNLSTKAKLASLFALATATASAAPIAIDLADASTSVTNAGTAMIGVAALIFGIGLVIYLLKR